MSSSNTSSAPSPSPSSPRSPSASLRAGDPPPPPPNLERIVQHFVSSKRALSSANSVWRSNELVTASRALLEELAGLHAKNVFAKRGVHDQVETLYAIKDAISDDAAAAGDEFRATIDKLDRANERLETTLNALRNTLVDVSLTTSSPKVYRGDESSEINEDRSTDSNDESTAQKNLYHFIDETRHEDLRTSLRDLIDSFNNARDELGDSIRRFEDSLQTINNTLASVSRKPDGPVDKTIMYDEPPPLIPELFHGIEDRAGEMATLLQSLVSHYDLCVTALKHTEGGREAARRAVQVAELNKNSLGVEESLYGKEALETMDDGERTELLRVLENDALEVEDVIAEIQDHATAMDSHFDHLNRHARRARSAHSALREVLAMMHDMNDVDLPAHLHALRTFCAAWETIQIGIHARTEEIIALCDFNDSFLSDYDKLLREVERRRLAARQLMKVAEKASKEIHRLEQADDEARADFMEDVGKYLPTDLWPAMKEPAVKWEVNAITPDDG